MITFILVQLVKSLPTSAVFRYIFAGGLFSLCLALLLRLIYIIVHRKVKKKFWLTIACAALLIELSCSVLFILPAKAVKLTYVGQIDVQYNMQSEESIPWDICIVDNAAQKLEVFLPPVEIDLNIQDWDVEKSTYLFVYGCNNVSLKRSFWDLEFNNTIPPTKVFFWGHLYNNGEIEPGKLYVFQLQPSMIPVMRYGIP